MLLGPVALRGVGEPCAISRMATRRGGVLGVASYLGYGAGRTVIPNSATNNNKQLMSRRWHRAKYPITSLQLGLANFHVSQSTFLETINPGSTTYSASIEYPEGVFHQLLFSGSPTKAAGSNLEFTDSKEIAIPEGAVFYSRVFVSSTGGIVFLATANPTLDTARGDALNFAASGLSDQTMGGTVANAGTGTAVYAPCVIVAQTRRPSLFLIGDSRTVGTFDTPDSSGDLGEIARSVGPHFGYINAGIAGDRAVRFLASKASRESLGDLYSSHVIVALGTNDIAASRTAVQVQNDLTAIAALFAGKPVFVATIGPRTTSTDGWATVANQTPIAQEAARVAVNSWIRGVPSGFAGYLEVADQVESARDSGKWKAGYTGDGIHANATGNLAVAGSGAIPAAFFL